MSINFYVAGKPAPQGSKIRTKWGMREANAGLFPWREAIVSQAIREGHSDTFIDGPVFVRVSFVFKRPGHHYRTGKFAGELRPNAPTQKTTAPDLDKLQRSVGDALVQAGILKDDDLIVRWDAAKAWGERDGAFINVIRL